MARTKAPIIEKKRTDKTIRDMPEDLWADFRLHCFQKRVKVKDAIVEAITDYMKKG